MALVVTSVVTSIPEDPAHLVSSNPSVSPGGGIAQLGERLCLQAAMNSKLLCDNTLEAPSWRASVQFLRKARQ